MHAITQVCRLAGQLASVCYLLVSLQAELRSCSIQALQLRQPAPAAYATLANAQTELPVTCDSAQLYVTPYPLPGVCSLQMRGRRWRCYQLGTISTPC